MIIKRFQAKTDNEAVEAAKKELSERKKQILKAHV